jgi:hypothetical protein
MPESCYAKWHKYALFAEYNYAECHYAEFPYAECRYVEGRGAVSIKVKESF